MSNKDDDQSKANQKQLCSTEMTGTSNPTATTMQALFEQNEYEEMRNISWAKLMEEEAMAKSSAATSQQTVSQDDAMECITISSGDEECPNLSSSKKTDPNGSKIKRTRLKRKGRTKFEHNVELTEALSCRMLKGNSSTLAVTLMGTDDEEGSTFSRHRKRRRKNTQRGKNVAESGKLNFSSKDLPLHSNPRLSRESSPGSTSSSIASTLRIKKSWQEPKLGWCTDEIVLQRRTKEIEKAKEKPVYAKYITKVPRNARKKGMPKTPNKYIQYSRRSWDKLVRSWKRQLYDWCGESPTESCLSSNESMITESDDEITSTTSAISGEENRPSLDEIKVEPDAAASLLGHLDIDTQNTVLTLKAEEESTLKGTSRSVLGPRDFSQL